MNRDELYSLARELERSALRVFPRIDSRYPAYVDDTVALIKAVASASAMLEVLADKLEKDEK